MMFGMGTDPVPVLGAPPVMPGTVVTTTGIPSTTPTTPPVVNTPVQGQWIQGVDNKYLIIGAAVVLLLSMKG